MGEAVAGAGKTIIYRISDGAKGVWWHDTEPMPGGYSLVPTIYPVMKPMGLVDTSGINIGKLTQPKNLILIGGAVGLFFFRKPLLKAVKKVGRKVGIK